MSTDATTMPFAATVDEASRLSGLSKTALYTLLSEGRIEARKRGRATLVLMDGVIRYVEELPKATFGPVGAKERRYGSCQTHCCDVG